MRSTREQRGFGDPRDNGCVRGRLCTVARGQGKPSCLPTLGVDVEAQTIDELIISLGMSFIGALTALVLITVIAAIAKVIDNRRQGSQANEEDAD